MKNYKFTLADLAIILALAVLIFGCNKETYPRQYIDGINQCYKHKEGNHMSNPYSLFPPKFTFSGTSLYGMEFEVVMDENCLYQHPDQDSLDWNKFLVLSDDWKRAEKNSMIPVWRCRDGKTLDVAWYGNDNYGLVLPNEQFDVVRKVRPGDRIKFNIVFNEREQTAHTWVFINDELRVIKIFELSYNPNGFRLFDPWFGGQKTAPHEMTFCIYTKLNLLQLEPIKDYVTIERTKVPARVIIESMLNIK